MRAANYTIATQKETPSDAEIASHRLMVRAGLVRQLASGIYSWLPMGYRVLRKVEAIIREEMDATGAQELMLPVVQPAELWQESGRWQEYDEGLLLKFKDRGQRDFCLGPTHEEVITSIARNELRSHKQLPVNLYQIQTKFRDETRPRFGVLRAREFVMKDAYSFHASSESLDETYQQMHAAYVRILQRMGLDFRAVAATSGSIGGSESMEYHVLAESGEDQLVFSDTGDYAANIELAGEGVKAGDPSPDGKGRLLVKRGIEVGHIFKLGDKYSKAMNATVLDAEGRQQALQMGCYGMGVTRLVGAIIEQNHDDKGISWPEPVAPFAAVVIPVGGHDSSAVQDAALELFSALLDAGVEALLDDREGVRPGAKFADAELLGFPHRLVVGERGLAKGVVEHTVRRTAETKELPPKAAVASLT